MAIREHLFSRRTPTDPMFRWRGGEVSRIEGLSDGVFAVTVSLLIVSLEVPRTFYELWETVKNLPVFGVCFVLLMMVWRYHYIYFRRYGMEDLLTSVLNAAFLFLVMFYAYPLKFMATFLWKLVLGEPTRSMFALPEGVTWAGGEMLQRAGMLYFYAFGALGVFGVLALMQLRAWAARDRLELDELERYLTVTSIRAMLIPVAVSLLAIGILAAGLQPGWAGICFFLLGPLHTIEGFHRGFGADRIRKRLTG